MDATIVTERPRLAPYLPAMRERLAACLAVQADAVNVKAKSAEAMGALGRGEGVLAQAVARIVPRAPGPAARRGASERAVTALWQALRADVGAALERDPAARNWLEVVLAYPGFHAREIHRLAHWLWTQDVPVLPRLLSHVGRAVTGIEIHPGAVIGERLFIDHGMGIVIGETTVIGDDCHLYQGVTLGGTSQRRAKRHPTLGNGVIVGAGAKLIGAITVGDGARIGAGSVVVASVPPHSTVVGVPGHVVAYYDPGNDTVLRLPDPERDRIDQLEERVLDLERRLIEAQAEMAARPPQPAALSEAARQRQPRRPPESVRAPAEGGGVRHNHRNRGAAIPLERSRTGRRRAALQHAHTPRRTVPAPARPDHHVRLRDHPL